MQRFELGASFEVDCSPIADFVPGEIYHVARNSAGGANLTPITQFFCWKPIFVEGHNPYWRVDCYVRRHALAPNPEWIGKALAEALLARGLCNEPLWVSWHDSAELGGKPYGPVFEDD
jgi:hypothetical protein